MFILNKMHSSILACAPDDFQKSFKNLKKMCHFKNALKTTMDKIAIVWCFSMLARPECNHLHFKSIKNALKIILSPKQSIFNLKIME